MHKNQLKKRQPLWQKFNLDLPLVFILLALVAYGFLVLYSAGGQDLELLIRQGIRFVIAAIILIIMSQLSPRVYQRWSLPLFGIGLLLLIAVLIIGYTGKGAQRWLDLGFFRFQPSEIMKLAVPMTLAWYLSHFHLPPRFIHILGGLALTVIPTLLIAKQPDLGTSLLVASSGLFVLFLAGMRWRLIALFLLLISAFVPFLWFFLMHNYQKQRVLTFLDPERDPLGTGYHTIQSKIAIGSGGINGKGWLEGTQSQLEFLPERHTDFIFAVLSEEFGFIGVFILLLLYLLIVIRGLYIAVRAQELYAKLLAGSITLTFFVYVFVNIGMVSGLLPVVGVPLPMISYGGTSMVTLMAGFGILCSISAHRRFLSHH